jgi:hypothetical protein
MGFSPKPTFSIFSNFPYRFSKAIFVPSESCFSLDQHFGADGFCILLLILLSSLGLLNRTSKYITFESSYIVVPQYGKHTAHKRITGRDSDYSPLGDVYQ